MKVPQSFTVSGTTYLVKLCHILKSTEITLQELAHPLELNNLRQHYVRLKAVTMMMSVNFWNIMPTNVYVHQLIYLYISPGEH
jgi:hypothetical protein